MSVKRILGLAIASSCLLPLNAFALREPTRIASPMQHWYINVGAKAAYLQHPGYQLPFAYTSQSFSQIITTTDAVDKKHYWAAMPTLALGYKFNNTFLPSLFGDTSSIELSGQYAHIGESNALSSLMGNVFIYRIDGRGKLPDFVTSSTLTALTYKFGYTYQHYGLNWVGDRKLMGTKLTSKPSFGLDYYQISQNNKTNYSIATGVPVIPGNTFSGNISDDATTHLVGLHFGEKLEYGFNNWMGGFFALDASLLHAFSNLSADQTQNGQPPTIPTSTTVSISNSSSRAITYIVSASTGLDFQLYHYKNSPNAITANLNAGISRWNYTPIIKYPTSASGQKAEVDGENSYNFFFGAEFHIPFS